MAQVNDFENGVDTHRVTGSKQRFPDEANKVFKYSSADNLLNNIEHLEQMIRDHEQYQRPRLQVLEDYYKGNNVTILSGQRRKEEHQADNRAVHNFAEYVVNIYQGYMFGIPLKTTHEDKDTNNKLLEMNIDNDADEHNSELGLNLSIYGRAYELVYRGQDDKDKFTNISVHNTFVVYDETVEEKPIVGVRYLKGDYSDDETVYVYTDNEIARYSRGKDGTLTKIEPTTEEEINQSINNFPGVPINEYKNNKFRMGDYEAVLTLIDLYDGAQSDIANYSQDLNDAMLVIIGNLEIDTEEAKHQKQYNLLVLKTEPNVNGSESKADAKYLYKQYDVQGSEAYKTRIANDIHLFTATPNLNDEHFSGVQSGESMKYKLFLLEQKRSIKERLFKKALRNRYRLISGMSDKASEGAFDVEDIRIVFSENLPENIAKELKWFTDAGGKLSLKTLLSLLRAVENPDEEIERIEEEERKKPTNRQGNNLFIVDEEVTEDE